MKVVVSYKATSPVTVDLGEFDTWEEAAAAALSQEKHVPSPENVPFYLESIWEDTGDELAYHNGHEVVGACDLCGKGIVDACGMGGCDGKTNHSKGGGWVTTKNGHRTWCSQECRDQGPEDFEREKA